VLEVHLVTSRGVERSGECAREVDVIVNLTAGEAGSAGHRHGLRPELGCGLALLGRPRPMVQQRGDEVREREEGGVLSWAGWAVWARERRAAGLK
jgi:hypothetical protein